MVLLIVLSKVVLTFESEDEIRVERCFPAVQGGSNFLESECKPEVGPLNKKGKKSGTCFVKQFKEELCLLMKSRI